MNKTFKIILCSAVCVLLITALVISSLFSKKVAMNPKGTIGNSAGNLNNGGLFCEYNGRVYFSNAADQDRLYSMNPDETDIKLLNKVRVRNVLAGGKYLYFYQSGSTAESGLGRLPGLLSFCRSNLNGQNLTALTTDSVVSAQLVDNYLYMQANNSEGTFFYKLKIDKSEKIDLTTEMINPACARDGEIYYNGVTNDHYLYKLNTVNDSVSELWNGNLWYPVLDGDYIYYMDVGGNYRICRYSLSTGEVQELTSDRADCFNVGNGYIYYQKNDPVKPQLKCMQTDGSNSLVIAEGNYTRIHMTSQYVYFQLFGEEQAIYHSLLGSSTYSVFASAASAEE